MRWNVVELAENGRYAKLQRGFLVVLCEDQELGRVTLDEINCLLLTAEQSTLSKPLMVKLAEWGIPIIICGQNYHPVSITLPYGAHHHYTRILQLQLSCSQPLRKRLWQQLVRAKIQFQALVLERCTPEQTGVIKLLNRLAESVKSGDADNKEAQAAKAYWKTLMGKGFKRDTDGGDTLNAALNYGYTIMRAGCARAAVAAGLTPALGLHHQNMNNPFCLVDDLMEVFRPLVDYQVWELQPEDGLQREHKQRLAALLQIDVTMNGQTTTVSTAQQKLANSLIQSYENKAVSLQLPQWEIDSNRRS